MATDNETPLILTPLHPSFGAECDGVDFSKPVSEQNIESIRTAMAKYGVLVFRNTKLDDAGHVAFARQFGELDVSAVYVLPWGKHRLAPHVELVDVSNLEGDRIVSEDSLRSKFGKGNGLFHVDCAYNAHRAGYSILRAHELPPEGTGGRTAFADTRTAYHDLDNKTKEKIKNYVVHHSFWQSRCLSDPQSWLFKLLYLTGGRTARHRLVQLHEPSGRMNLYIASHALRFDGLTKEKSQPMIQNLLQHASNDKYTFEVEWKNNGDFVMWDNTCVMHRACGGAFEGKYVRDMRRATVYDSSTSAWGLNQKS